MLEGIREQLERQVERLLEEAERPMRVEEILPHLDPILPTPNDVADVLAELAESHEVEREGSYYSRPTPVPIEDLFAGEAQRRAAAVVVQIVRELDEQTGEGARFPAVVKVATKRGVPTDLVLDVVTVLRNAGELYSVGGDKMRAAKP